MPFWQEMKNWALKALQGLRTECTRRLAAKVRRGRGRRNMQLGVLLQRWYASHRCVYLLSLSLSLTHTHTNAHTHTHMHTHTSKTSLMLEAAGRMGQNLRPCTDHGARHANDRIRARISKHDRRTAAVVPVEFRERQSSLRDSSGAAFVRPASEHGLQHRWAHAGNSLPLTKQT